LKGENVMGKEERFVLPDDIVFGYVPSPGEIIRDELEARGWAQKDLANIMDRPIQAINEIINAKKEITTETAIELGAAFGTSADYWLNLEKNYRLWLEKKEKEKEETDHIRRRSRIYSLAPIRKIQKRGWIKKTRDIVELKKEVCQFFNIDDIFSDPQLCLANFRFSVERGAEEMSVRSWVRRVEQIAETIKVNTFAEEPFDILVDELLSLSYFIEDVAQVPDVLKKYGINFLILEHLPQTYIDGAAFWIEKQPTIVLTLRYDRVDSFWFTLFHELGHIKFGHEVHVDDLSTSKNLSETDQIANQWAVEQLLDHGKFEAFIRENQPRYSKQAVEDFAYRIQRHPGIIIGQLQHREEISYATMRMYLEKVKPYLEPWIYE
jgi:HTH-type transcriptional regulator / antitoxin HigA